MFYYLYEVRNNLNGKIYVGVHKTKSLDDGYMGSGKVIQSAIAKYGIENFTKVVLETFDTSEAMYAREKEVVTDEFLLRGDVYNLRRGGSGGFDYINKNDLHKNYGSSNVFSRINTELSNRRIDKLKYDPTFRLRWSHVRPGAGVLEKAVLAALSDSAREKRKDTMKANLHGVGSNNSQFGTMWITNGVESVRIKKDDLIPPKWYKGRKQRSAI
jgi:hypothetical protein